MRTELHTRGYRPEPGERTHDAQVFYGAWHWLRSGRTQRVMRAHDEARACLVARSAPDPLILRNLDRVSNNEAFRLYAFMHREGLGHEDMVNDARRSND